MLDGSAEGGCAALKALWIVVRFATSPHAKAVGGAKGHSGKWRSREILDDQVWGGERPGTIRGMGDTGEENGGHRRQTLEVRG